MPELNGFDLLEFFTGKLFEVIFVTAQLENKTQFQINGLSYESISQFWIDKDINAWISTFPQNVFYYYKPGKLTKLNTHLNTENISINDIMQDNEGNIWAATYSKGVFCFHHQYLTLYNHYDGLNVEYITSLAQHDNKIFAGTYDGIFMLDTNSFQKLQYYPDSLEYIRCMYFDENNLYAGVSDVPANKLLLDSSAKSFITLREELDRLNNYLELEKLRFGGKLNYSIHVDEHIDKLNTVIPNMIIQPFVENALWHGILPQNKPGKILISFIKKDNQLSVHIDDNGIGINESKTCGSRKNNLLV